MRQSWQTRFRDPANRRRALLILATVEERLVEAHARAAEGFLRATNGELPYEKGMEIFHRMLVVPERIREPVSLQALSRLAQAPDDGAPGGHLQTGFRGLFGGIRRRLGGRRANGLRLRVDRAARQAQDFIEGAYLEGATLVMRELDGSIAPAEAVQLFIDALEIEPGWQERVFHKAVAAAPDQPRGRAEPPQEAAA